MQEDPVELVDDRLANEGSTDSGWKAASINVSPGFTAVNGNGRRANERNKQATLSQSIHSHDTGVTDHGHLQSHGWRPAEHDLAIAQNVTSHVQDTRGTNKRKRSSSNEATPRRSTTRPERTDTGDRASSKRRALDRNEDSAIVVSPSIAGSAPVSHTHHDKERAKRPPASADVHERSTSPARRGKQRPKPHPDALAELQELVEDSKQGRDQDQQAQEIPKAHDVSSPLPLSRENGSQANERSEQVDDASDQKKKKRNFSNRTKTGCKTCRRRKKKCDERKPGCNNCARANFACEGYGPNPPAPKAAEGRRAMPPLQSKELHESTNGSSNYYASSVREGSTCSRWAGNPPEHEPLRRYAAETVPLDVPLPSSRDSWQNSSWTLRQEPILPAPPDRRTTTHGYAYPPLNSWDLDQRHSTVPSARFAPYALSEPQPPRHPVSSFPYSGVPHSSSAGYLAHDVASTSSGSQRSGPLAIRYSNQPMSDKEKMLRGYPFRHYDDNDLEADRSSCAVAVATWNKTFYEPDDNDSERKSRKFNQILMPSIRPTSPIERTPYTPEGSIGHRVRVFAPFNCLYGYNINLGKDIVIDRGCYMQDAANITIGDRVIIGPDVSFYCLDAAVDREKRQGLHGTFQAGAIKIEDDVYIGGGSIILAYRTIGKGAVIGAGSLVTRDVKEYNVVAGRPAKFVRKITPGTVIPERHEDEIKSQNDKMKAWMKDYADRGFHAYNGSPRLK